MVQVEAKLMTVTGIDHPSSFATPLPVWSTIHDLTTAIAEHFYLVRLA